MVLRGSAGHRFEQPPEGRKRRKATFRTGGALDSPWRAWSALRLAMSTEFSYEPYKECSCRSAVTDGYGADGNASLAAPLSGEISRRSRKIRRAGSSRRLPRPALLAVEHRLRFGVGAEALELLREHQPIVRVDVPGLHELLLRAGEFLAQRAVVPFGSCRQARPSRCSSRRL